MISVDMTPFGITVVCSTAVCYGDTPLVLLYIAQKLGAIFAWAAMTPGPVFTVHKYSSTCMFGLKPWKVT